MLIKYKFNNPNQLLLIPSLWLAIDFLPLWYFYSVALMLIFTSFFKIHRFFGYISFIFVFYIFQTVGMQIIPETMIPTLASFLLAQIVYNKATDRDESFIFFLWIGIFSVFSASFSYLVYSIFVIIYFFAQQTSTDNINFKAVIKTIITQKYQLLFTGILAVILFIFFPRFYNFLPSANFQTKGEIGYSKNIKNSMTSDLELSNKIAFYAEIDRVLSQDLLYWRGHVNTTTDGYNWDSANMLMIKEKVSYPQNLNLINIKMKYEQDFDGDVIILDRPFQIKETNFQIYQQKQTNEFKFYRKGKKATFTSQSTLETGIVDPLPENRKEAFTQLPNFIPKVVKNIAEIIKADTPEKTILNFKRYLIKEKYSYTLKPGPLPTMKDFVEKKKGFCSHYASLLGIVLRLNKIPTRLISGFQGGEYNQYGKYYLITSNDAHAWVEYYDNNRWQRVDPTSFVSPGRINLGGTTFLQQGSASEFANRQENLISRYFNAVKLQWENINYKVSLFFDNYNRDKQEDLSKLINMSLKTFFILGFIIISLIIGIYVYITQYRKTYTLHPCDKEMLKLARKLKLKPAQFNYKSIAELEHIIYSTKFKYQNDKIQSIIKTYQTTKYSKHNDINTLKEMIKNL